MYLISIKKLSETSKQSKCSNIIFLKYVSSKTFKAFINCLCLQRSELKLKLEESSQQLLSIKSDWSDKITKLETQKAHLNSKISEDTFEHEEKCKNYESKIHSLTMQVRFFNCWMILFLRLV